MKTNKIYRGFVTLTKANPKPYHFDGFEADETEPVSFDFRVFSIPGNVSPSTFLERVEVQHPLPVSLTLFPPQYDLGRITYYHSSTGETHEVPVEEVGPHDQCDNPGDSERSPSPETDEVRRDLDIGPEDVASPGWEF